LNFSGRRRFARKPREEFRRGKPNACAKVLLVLLFASAGQANTAYYQRTLFDNSLTPDAYFYSSGKPSAPSSLNLLEGKLPVEHHNFFTAPNALRLTWTSRPQGGWVAAIRVYAWRNRVLLFPGDTLAFHCFSQKGIARAALP